MKYIAIQNEKNIYKKYHELTLWFAKFNALENSQILIGL